MSIDVKYRIAATATEVAMEELGPRMANSICTFPYPKRSAAREEMVSIRSNSSPPGTPPVF